MICNVPYNYVPNGFDNGPNISRAKWFSQKAMISGRYLSVKKVFPPSWVVSFSTQVFLAFLKFYPCLTVFSQVFLNVLMKRGFPSKTDRCKVCQVSSTSLSRQTIPYLTSFPSFLKFSPSFRQKLTCQVFLVFFKYFWFSPSFPDVLQVFLVFV